MDKLARRLKKALDANDGKIPVEFLQEKIKHTKITHHQMTPNTRVCVITTLSGHDVVGYAQVLDSKNDVEEIGQQIAYQRAADEPWSVFGSIAKVL